MDIMKKLFSEALLALVLFCLTIPAEAMMTNITNTDIVLDDISGLVWYRNVASFKDQTYDQQLNSISSLNTFYDVDEDGIMDKLIWNIASLSTVNDLIFNYQLENETNRSAMMRYFTLTRFEGNMIQTEEILGSIGTNSTLGTFKLLQVYDYNIPVTPPDSDWVQDIYYYGETSVSVPLPYGPGSIFPPILPPTAGAWANATVIYGHSVPIPSTISLLGISLLGLAGVRRKNSIR